MRQFAEVERLCKTHFKGCFEKSSMSPSIQYLKIVNLCLSLHHLKVHYAAFLNLYKNVFQNVHYFIIFTMFCNILIYCNLI